VALVFKIQRWKCDIISAVSHNDPQTAKAYPLSRPSLPRTRKLLLIGQDFYNYFLHNNFKVWLKMQKTHKNHVSCQREEYAYAWRTLSPSTEPAVLCWFMVKKFPSPLMPQMRIMKIWCHMAWPQISPTWNDQRFERQASTERPALTKTLRLQQYRNIMIQLSQLAAVLKFDPALKKLLTD
jgi:hypothetical protein